MLRKGIGRAAAIAAASLLLGFGQIVVPGAAHLPVAHADAGYFDDCAYDWLHCGTGEQVDLTADQVRARTDLCLWDNNDGSHPNAAVCIKRDGDVVFVRDTDSDGRSALGQIGFTVDNIYVCRNGHGSGTWARCDFQWPENDARLRTVDCDFDNAPISFGSSECTRSERYVDFMG
ncbi:hypothetical protein [Kribbella sp. NPDC003557]|uniref:hypothetical protein n=1 Tax=Kribbella sp. NPDC003557 TaxID=3154449 RepID=UPI0033A8BE18